MSQADLIWTIEMNGAKDRTIHNLLCAKEAMETLDIGNEEMITSMLKIEVVNERLKYAVEEIAKLRNLVAMQKPQGEKGGAA